MKPKWIYVLLLGLVAGLMATAFLLINTTFMLYDDEGYVLLSFQKFISGERLYSDIFSQYGPFSYLYSWSIATLLGTQFTHTLGRSITALHWVSSSVFAGALAFRLTRDFKSGIIACLASFGLLWQIISEPSHPGSLICAILAPTAYLTCCLYQAQRWRLLAVVTGLTAGILVLTKINIGIFFISGAGAGALLLTNWPKRYQNLSVWLTLFGFIAMPWGLMRANLHDPSVWTFALQFTIGIASILWVKPIASSERVIPPPSWIPGLVAFAGTLVAIYTFILLRGTSSADFIHGVFISPLRHPAHFRLPVPWSKFLWPVTFICTLILATAGWELRRYGALKLITSNVIAAARLLIAAYFISETSTWVTNEGIRIFMGYTLVVTPLFLINLKGTKPESPTDQDQALLWMALLITPQVLHAYPVAGSQMSWGTFLVVPLLVTGIYRQGNTTPLIPKFIVKCVPWALLAASATIVGLLLQTGWQRYTTSKPLLLPGAEHIRMNGPARLLLRTLTLNASIHADVLFSRPGMFSYNIWSNTQPPTSQNATHWFWLLDSSAQAKIEERLLATPSNAVITSGILEDYLAQAGISMESPLHRFIQSHYKSLFSINRFEFLVPNNSKAVPFGLIDVFTSSAKASAQPNLIQTNVALRGTPASIHLEGVDHPWAKVVDYSAPDSDITIEPITAQGAPLGKAIKLSDAGNLNGLYRIYIYTKQPLPVGRLSKLVLVVLDSHHAVMSESIFN